MENSKDNNTSQLTNKSTAEKNTKDKNKQKYFSKFESSYS